MGHWNLLIGGAEHRSSVDADDRLHVAEPLVRDVKMTTGSDLGVFLGL